MTGPDRDDLGSPDGRAISGFESPEAAARAARAGRPAPDRPGAGPSARARRYRGSVAPSGGRQIKS